MVLDDPIGKIIRQLEDHERRISQLEGIPSQINGKIKKLSLKEFMLMKQPTDDVQKTLIIGYYLERLEGMNSFNAKDLAEGFRSAREPVPLNINDKINLNVRKGYIMLAKEKKDNFKAWILTNSGERSVENMRSSNNIESHITK